MDPMDNITLGGQDFDIHPIPLGRLKKLIPAFRRAGGAFLDERMDDQTMDDIITILSSGTGEKIEVIEAIPATFSEIIMAIDVIAHVSGLAVRPAGESAAVETRGTISTAG